MPNKEILIKLEVKGLRHVIQRIPKKTRRLCPYFNPLEIFLRYPSGAFHLLDGPLHFFSFKIMCFLLDRNRTTHNIRGQVSGAR